MALNVLVTKPCLLTHFLLFPAIVIAILLRLLNHFEEPIAS